MGQYGIRLPIKSFVHQRYVSSKLQESHRDPPRSTRIPKGGIFALHAWERPIFVFWPAARLKTARRNGWKTLPSTWPAFPPLQTCAPTCQPTLSPLVPKLAATTWESEQVGLISFSFDGEPILGTLPQLPGLVVGAAFHSGGFAYSPVAGLLLAELAAGDATSVDVTFIFTDPVLRGGHRRLFGVNRSAGRRNPPPPLIGPQAASRKLDNKASFWHSCGGRAGRPLWLQNHRANHLWRAAVALSVRRSDTHPSATPAIRQTDGLRISSLHKLRQSYPPPSSLAAPAT